MDLLPSSKGWTRELPQTDCQKLSVSDFRPKSGARSKGLQSEAERRQRASSLTVDQRWVGGQSVQLVGMRRVRSAAQRGNRMPVTSILRTYTHSQTPASGFKIFFLRISHPEIKYYSIGCSSKMSQRLVWTMWCDGRVFISHSVRDRSIGSFHHRGSSLFSPVTIAEQQIKPPRWDEGYFILHLIMTNEAGWKLQHTHKFVAVPDIRNLPVCR